MTASVEICASRGEPIPAQHGLANVAVIAAAVLVAWTGSAWPDLALSGIIALLLLHSACEIGTGALRELGKR